MNNNVRTHLYVICEKRVQTVYISSSLISTIHYRCMHRLVTCLVNTIVIQILIACIVEDAGLRLERSFQGGASFVNHLCYFCLVFIML